MLDGVGWCFNVVQTYASRVAVDNVLALNGAVVT
jgi:hypothetical protein